MIPVIFGYGDSMPIASRLSATLTADPGAFEQRRFPDDETYMRLQSNVSGRAAVVCATLDRPDPKLLPLHFLASVCRDEGARSVGLVAPYLAYMRQDRQFHQGEAVASHYFADLVSHSFDWLVTVDPHLHRIKDLSDLYAIPTRVVQAAPAWVRTNIEKPLFVGPDEESEQWVAAVAQDASAPCIVLEKTRKGDRDVEVSVPEVDRWRDHTPVLVDDIISTGRTMIQTVSHLRAAGMKPPTCIGVHAVFAGDAYEALVGAGAQRVATCNTIPHTSNTIDVLPQIAESVRAFV